MPSIETQKRMHAFFMKTSAPRILKEIKEQEAKQKEAQNEHNQQTMVSDVG